MKYIVSTRAISENDINFAYETIKKNGFYVEIDSLHLSDYVTVDIEPYAIHLPYEGIYLTHPSEKIRKESVKKIIRELKKAYSKKVKLAVLHIEGGYEDSPKIPIEEKVSNFKVAASEILENAKKFEIKIALENNGFIKDSFSDPDEILMVLEDLAKEYNNVGVCFDIGHANVYAHDSGENLMAIFKALKIYIIHVHIHENLGVKDDHLPPQGIFNNTLYRELMALDNTSFSFETKGPSGMKGILKGIELIDNAVKKGGEYRNNARIGFKSSIKAY